jgi:regulator of sigma E protease
MGIITAIFILSFLIFFHELGHFLIARLVGVKVEIFSIGFGKKLLCKKFGDTSWCLSAIPLGGYVQMKGQDDTNPTIKNYDKDSYMSKTPLQKIAILLGGPGFNILLAFLIYLFISFYGWQKLAPEVGNILPNSAAENILKKGDLIVKINNYTIHTWNDIKKAVDNSHIPLHLIVKRNNKLLQFSITPKIMQTKNIFSETIKRKLIGISPSGKLIIIHYYNPLTALKMAFDETIAKSIVIFKSFEKLITGVIGLNNISGPITIVKVTSDATHYGIIPLLLLTALISVNLGILNLLPIPALDGGHIIFNLYELVVRKPVNENIMIKLTIMGWGILGSLMLLGIFNDIIRLTNNN